MPHDPRPSPDASRIADPEAGTMVAAVQDRYGTDPDAVLRIERVARPVVGAGEVLVRVRAAAVDQGTVHLMTGLPYLVRLGFGLRGPKRRVPGLDLAGIVEEVGAGVTDLAPGEEVFGTSHGSFAELAPAPADHLAPKPPSLTFEQAAAMPVSGLTALQAVRDRAGVTAGESVLVLGASGGVGSYVVQIAKAFGAEVTGVCRTEKVDLVRSLGADHVVDHTVDDVTAGERRFDVVIDSGGNTRVSRLRRILAPAGRLVIVGGENGGRWTGGIQRQAGAMALSPFVGQTLTTFVSSENADDLRALTELVEAGQLRPAVDRTYPLREAAAALRHVSEGRVRGKVVITV
ncbi:MAG: NAD(P)-dependent alcohol dehydrogenase [Acidimicrobiales bacterium]|jgi:NADPH:quinone reductase-like Zn-dependent oxidoreductase|nr:NAD(P)-dependent alcohol dehydrogenase [Acidimicrobiales bacterium]